MVVDTCVLLAVFFREDRAAWAQAQLDQHAGTLVMSTVNLAETLAILRSRNPQAFSTLERDVLSAGIRFVAPDVAQARAASAALRQYEKLNFGDAFLFALAEAESLPILTLDSDFLKTPHKVVHPDNP